MYENVFFVFLFCFSFNITFYHLFINSDFKDFFLIFIYFYFFYFYNINYLLFLKNEIMNGDWGLWIGPNPQSPLVRIISIKYIN